MAVPPAAAGLPSRRLHLEHLTRPGPAAFVSVGAPRVQRGRVDAEELEQAVTAEVDAILDVVREHGEEAAARWDAAPARVAAA